MFEAFAEKDASREVAASREILNNTKSNILGVKCWI